VNGAAVLETERLRLRPWREADLPVLRAIAMDPVLMAHFGRPALVDDTDARFERMQRWERERGFSFWASRAER
jgi:RimJ/RimL family protein N-acetyltransferase